MMMPFYQRMKLQNLLLHYFLFLISWKIAGNVPGVELRLSDKRLFHIINHIQSIPFPESKHPVDEIPILEAEVRFVCFS
jgi:hypothetical protein